MAEVSVRVGQRSYRLSCGDGEEAALESAAAYLDGKAKVLIESLGALGEGRLLLMSALIVVGELQKLRAETPGTAPAADTALADALPSLVARVESLADALEKAAQDA